MPSLAEAPKVMQISTEFIALLFGMGIQFAGTVWWAATMSSKVSGLEKAVTKMDGEQRTQDAALNDMRSTLARLDERSAQSIEYLRQVNSELKSMRNKNLELPLG